MPELAKQESIRPKRSSVAVNAASIAASSPTSQMNPSASAPRDLSRSTAATFLSAFVPQTAIDAPALAIPSAIPSPIPELPPVTRATWPVRSNGFCGVEGVGVVVTTLDRSDASRAVRGRRPRTARSRTTSAGAGLQSAVVTIASPPEQLSAIVSQVDARIAGLLTAELDRWRDVDDALVLPVTTLSDLALNGGKRLRPIFCHLGHLGAGGDPDDPVVVDAGAALELLHAFALVHDDVMDGSSTRRGAPTVHEPSRTFSTGASAGAVKGVVSVRAWPS